MKNIIFNLLILISLIAMSNTVCMEGLTTQQRRIQQTVKALWDDSRAQMLWEDPARHIPTDLNAGSYFLMYHGILLSAAQIQNLNTPYSTCVAMAMYRKLIVNNNVPNTIKTTAREKVATIHSNPEIEKCVEQINRRVNLQIIGRTLDQPDSDSEQVRTISYDTDSDID